MTTGVPVLLWRGLLGRRSAGSGGGMMGAATTADMSSYMDLFERHTAIRRTVVEVPGGVRTTTESDDPALAAHLQAHVSSMYGHVQHGQEVPSRPDLKPSTLELSPAPDGSRLQSSFSLAIAK